MPPSPAYSATAMTNLDQAEFTRWRAQATRALDTALLAETGERFEWACFLAEQAAQLAVKGVLHGLGEEAWGHDLVMLEGRAVEVLSSCWSRPTGDEAARLSRHYIGTRYPDAHASGEPGSHYTRADAQEALADARTLLGAVDAAWAALDGGP